MPSAAGADKTAVTDTFATCAPRRRGETSPAERSSDSSGFPVRTSLSRRAVALGLAGSALMAAGCSIGGGSNPLADSLATSDTGTDKTVQDGRAVEAKVALLLPLSGTAQAAAVARGMKQAAEMALFDLNNPSFQMVVKDTQGTPEGAAAAATQAAADGAELIIGPLFAQSVRAVKPVAQQAGLPVIAFSNDRTVAGSGVHLLSFMADEEVDRIVSFAATQGRRSLAALIPDNAYGNVMAAAFKAAAQRNGARVVAVERYPANSSGLLGPSQKLFAQVQEARAQGLDVDAIFLPGGPETLPNLTPLTSFANTGTGAGAPPKFLGSGGWDYPNLGRNQTLVGSWYPAPDPRGWQAFSENFTRTFGSAPPRIATLAHDALTVAIRLATQHPRGSRYNAQTIGRASGFVGIDGPFRFNGDGTSSHTLAVLEVQRYQSVVIDPAQAGFSSGPVSSVATGALSDLESRSVAVQN